jgi:hypothetical protein
MDLSPQIVARETARYISCELDQPGLAREVDVVLRAGPRRDTKLDATTAASLATLIVAAAQLAWAIYSGLTGEGSKTDVAMQDELGRRLKIQTNAPPEAIEKIVRHTTKTFFRDQA